MPKKKTNAFAKFMFELKKEEEKAGNQISMMKLQSKAGDLWKKMSQQERNNYKSSCAPFDLKLKRYNTIGEDIDEREKRESDKIAMEDQKIIFVEESIKELKEKLDTQVFYFFSTSYFFKLTHQEDIFPAELAISKFSLRDGIIDTMHLLINPGELPLGMKAEAMFHAKKSHRFKLPPNIEGEKSYVNILNAILDFMNIEEYSSQKMPPFYVYSEMEGDHFEAAELTLAKITRENDVNNIFRVYQAEQLLFSMHKWCMKKKASSHSGSLIQKPLTSKFAAMEVLGLDKFTYASIGCPFHNMQDNSQNCCLSKVIRWGYAISTHCLDDRFEKHLGKHIPIDHVEDDYEDFGVPSRIDSSASGFSDSFQLLNLNSTSSFSVALNSTNSNSSTNTTTNTFKPFSIPSSSDMKNKLNFGSLYQHGTRLTDSNGNNSELSADISISKNL